MTVDFWTYVYWKFLTQIEPKSMLLSCRHPVAGHLYIGHSNVTVV